MKIDQRDATWLFNYGGYFDTQTGEYILCDYLLKKFQEKFPEMPTPDYEKMKSMPERYLEAPAVNSMHIIRYAALELGFSVETLRKMGLTDEECRDAFLSMEETRKRRTPGYDCAQYDVIHDFNEYMFDTKQADVYFNKREEYCHRLMRDWLKAHGIDMD